MSPNQAGSRQATAQLVQFRDAIESCIGLQFDDSKTRLLAEVLDRRAHATSRRPSEYVEYVTNQRPGTELAELAMELTVPETYFFRNIDQFHALVDCAIPASLRTRKGVRDLRILSAGCASGEEAYTIAILLRDLLEPGLTASVLAVDLSASILDKARLGRYSSWSLRETPQSVQKRWFRREGPEVVLDDEIKQMVRFEQHNLADRDGPLWARGPFDVIFCRNVMMYFSADGARALVGRLTRTLAPDGFLFLGHAETLRGVSHDFQLRHTHGTFYYQRNPAEAHTGPSAETAFPARSGRSDGPADTWVETIQAASERVHALATLERRTDDSGPGNSDSPPEDPSATVATVVERLRAEQFAEALALLEPLTRGGAQDPEVLVLQAAVTVQAGHLDSAEEVCRRLLQLDASNAAAHYALALCREGVGDLDAALEHDRRAISLDPSFAMPRLHRGLLARQTRDFGLMRSELSTAADLLREEDGARIVLFGGGFDRDALITICRAQLTDRVSS